MSYISDHSKMNWMADEDFAENYRKAYCAGRTVCEDTRIIFSPTPEYTTAINALLSAAEAAPTVCDQLTAYMHIGNAAWADPQTQQTCCRKIENAIDRLRVRYTRARVVKEMIIGGQHSPTMHSPTMILFLLNKLYTIAEDMEHVRPGHTKNIVEAYGAVNGICTLQIAVYNRNSAPTPIMVESIREGATLRLLSLQMKMRGATHS